MAKYLDPKADLTFKKIFGEHSDLVASLLNALLPLPEDSRIASVEYLQPEVVPDDPLHKDSIVDVRCRDQLGRQFVVEMQMIWTVDYAQRALFNAAKAYVRQLPAGGDYRDLKTVYSLNLINEVVNPDIPEYYNYYTLEHSRYKGRTIDGIQIIFVELPKFTPQTRAERRMQVLWLRFLTEINENTRKAPAELEADPDVKRALAIVEESALDDAERARYDGFIDWLRRERGRARLEREYNEKVSRLETLEAERDEERARADAAAAERDAAVEKLRQTARALKSMNLPVGQIAAATGLTGEEIDAL
ncbi:MAG: Rpn family recombination-promoting nuclease/putative transposase [Kiritimatiellae bacterium]|nr:Rpn family recombination-promoting nuclease/putative transposase [Kiritimatiellia bacterium]